MHTLIKGQRQLKNTRFSFLWKRVKNKSAHFTLFRRFWIKELWETQSSIWLNGRGGKKKHGNQLKISLKYLKWSMSIRKRIKKIGDRFKEKASIVLQKNNFVKMIIILKRNRQSKKEKKRDWRKTVKDI